MLVVQETSAYRLHNRLACIVAIPFAADTNDRTWLLLVDKVCRIVLYYRKAPGTSCKVAFSIGGSSNRVVRQRLHVGDEGPEAVLRGYFHKMYSLVSFLITY